MSEANAESNVPVATEVAPVPEAAPGCETPTPEKAKRIDYPALVEAGGKFVSIGEDGKGHFNIDLMPELPPWPEMKDADGKTIPLPWEDHSRLTHFALTRDCFGTDAEYYYFLAWERYNRARTARDKFVEAKTGASTDAGKNLKKVEKLSKELEAMAAVLSGKGVDIQALMQALGQVKEEQTQAVLSAS